MTFPLAKIFAWLRRIAPAGAVALVALRAVEPFTPLQPDPLREAWRWTRFEQFDGQGFRCMAEAPDGTMWFGFRENAVHFDGLHTTTFGEAQGLLGAPAKSLHVARDGSVYALTRTHFLRYDGRAWHSLATLKNQSVPGNRLQEAPDGAIWALTPDELLCYRDGNLLRVSDVPRPLSQFTIDAGNALWLLPEQGGVAWQCPVEHGELAPRAAWTAHPIYPANTRTQFGALAARDGSIWIVTENDALPAMRYDPATRAWRRLDLRTNGGTLNDYAVTESADGTIWIAGQGRLHAVRGDAVTVYTQAELNSMPFYRYAVHAGADGTLWLCGNGGYVYRIDCSDRHWSSFLELAFQAQGRDGVRWFITRDYHVVAHDPARGTWRQFTAADGLMDRPVALNVSRDGTIWAAGSDGEGAAVARLDGARWHLDRHPKFARGIARQSIYETRGGDMLFGAEFERAVSPGCTGGLLRYHFDGAAWQVTSIVAPAAPFRVITIAEGDDGSLWLGGDILWRIKNGRAIDAGFPAPASLPRPLNVARDRDGAIWIAQWGGGVYRFAHGRWDHFTERHGLASDLVAGVATAPDGGVWAASPGALSRFDGERWVRTALPPHFGLDLGPSHLRVAPDNAVWIVTTAEGWYEPRRAPAGGSANYLRTFRYHPEGEPPETVLSAGPAEVAEKQPALFVWHGLDRWAETPAELLEFSHRIDGGAWSPFARTRNLTLTELSAGRHTLEVRARDRDFNIEPTPARVSFAVIPPAWRQPWFIGLVAAFVATVATLIWLLVRLRIRHVLQLGELKVQFFTNISHELRTPLTVILGPLERMRQETPDPRSRARLETIRQNAAHMLALVDQILDFRRLQLRPAPPACEPADVVALLRAQHERFRAYADDKAIALTFAATPAAWSAGIDRDHLVKIADNLLSNAIKYTPAGGEIRIEVIVAAAADAAATLTLTVLDSGIGIPTVEQARIFELFYRAAAAQQQGTRGAGIGLAFTRELVERAGGRIAVQSPAFPPAAPTCGSRFTVTLPLALAPASVASPEKITASLAEAALPMPSPAATADKPTLLIVDDNADIRRLLHDEFESTHIVLEAADGAQALRLAGEHLPECVVADLMMPGLDGRQLCARIKTDELTAHIPVILLTARASLESQLHGLGAGADDYVTKPVSFTVLRARVENVIAARAKLRERFGRQVFLAPQEVAITPANEQFVQRALRVVEEHMSDTEFDVETFARAMGLSRASLFRKFKAISGQSPSDFIRELRLERARQLLASGQFNVSQTAAEVGFGDLSHFAASFRKKFDQAPSDFARHAADGA